ncbi:MAG: AraC family transcriptional regulator [Pleurocapsa sp. CRU_1_2]|nr:AraC family transcriptional regulator [Pleurocapsa sp. CRU_1_2]
MNNPIMFEKDTTMPSANCVAPPRTLSLSTQILDRAPKITVFRSTGSDTQSSHPHAHSFFELFFIEEGEGWYSIGDRQLWAKSGDLFLIAPGEVHDPSGLDHATKWIVGFEAEALHPAYTDANIFLMLPSRVIESFLPINDLKIKHFYIPAKERSRWLDLFEQLKDELGNKELSFIEAARALLMLLLIETARFSEPQLPQSTKSSTQRSAKKGSPVVEKVLYFIATNFRKSIGLQEVAKEVNFSPAYLTDLIRRETGKTVGGWIAERRMTEARHLLLATDLPVNQIAESVGYFDSSYFIRLFRRLNGTTPQAWRLLYRQ